ncbi:MAG TPA: aspartyl protease family protein [Cyclobacteriaceae bacterium]
MKTLLLAYFMIVLPMSDHQYEYIRIINLQQKPIVAGTLNGKKVYFLLDTGSDFTLLNETETKKYGFKTVNRESDLIVNKAVGMGGTIVEFKSVYNVSISLGSTRISTTCLAYDMSLLVTIIRNRSGIEISGIIGSDVMKRYGVIIDYANKEVGLISGRKDSIMP